MGSIKARALRWLYLAGVLGLWHRWRNRDTLTVVMFHRVSDFAVELGRSEWPGWTITPGFLDECLCFFRRHYHLVSARQVVEARTGGSPLPQRSLLLTFDDGWVDAFEVAQPILLQHGAPALLFVITGVEDGRECWQEPALRAWAVKYAKDEGDRLSFHRHLASLQSLSEKEREADLERIGLLVAPPRTGAMWRPSNLRAWTEAMLEVGAHGTSHHPLTVIASPEAELSGAKVHLEELLQQPVNMVSFPHGLYDEAVLRHTVDAGYDCAFSSDPVLNYCPDRRPNMLLGRVEPTMSYNADENGQLLPYRLASLLFFLPRNQLRPQA